MTDTPDNQPARETHDPQHSVPRYVYDWMSADLDDLRAKLKRQAVREARYQLAAAVAVLIGLGYVLHLLIW